MGGGGGGARGGSRQIDNDSDKEADTEKQITESRQIETGKGQTEKVSNGKWG